MSTATTTRTPEAVAAEAARILRQVRQAQWPHGREARWAIGWAAGTAGEAAGTWVALLHGDIYPRQAVPEDMEWRSRQDALEWAADQFLQCAQAAQARLGEYQRRADEEEEGREVLALMGTEGGER